MSGINEPATLIHFGSFEADLLSQELRKHGVRLRLPGQSFQILKMLLERPGEVVSREELRAKLWPADTFVDFDHGLNAAVKRLRDALGDTAENLSFAKTPAGLKISKMPQRGVTCYMHDFTGVRKYCGPQVKTLACWLS